jgi:hypothetical protein
MAKKKKEPELKEFCVPMTWEYRGEALVKARDADHAKEVARSGSFKQDESTAELINWEVTGSAYENK